MANVHPSEAFEPRLAQSCRSLSRFLEHEVARSISTSPGRDASPSQATPPQFVRFPQQFADTLLYTWVERGIARVKCPRPGFEPGPLASESSALTMHMRRSRLPQFFFILLINKCVLDANLNYLPCYFWNDLPSLGDINDQKSNFVEKDDLSRHKIFL